MLEVHSLWETDAHLGQVTLWSAVNDTEISSVGKWHIVGKDDFSGRLLVTWKNETVVDRSNCNGETVTEPVVKVGLLDLNGKEIHVIFTCHEYYDIIDCAVDKNLQRLAFIDRTSKRHNVQIQNSDFETTSNGSYGMEEIGYMCYWTSLLQCSNELPNIRPLNKETPDFMRVQFLSESQLLVFVPHEAIYLYTLPSENDIRKNGFLSPVLYERLAGTFLWAEWNMVARQIFYLHLRCRPQTLNNRLDSSYLCTTHETGSRHIGDLSAMLVGLQFNPGSPFETVMNIPLDMLNPISQDALTRTHHAPDHSMKYGFLTNRIHDPTFDLDFAVFTHIHGAVYICQGMVKKKESNSLYSEMRNQNKDVDIKYSITMLHQGCTLYCSVQGGLNQQVAYPKIMFMPYKDFMLVVVPGVFTHLLDTGLEHEPCNHVLSLGCALPVPDAEKYSAAALLQTEYHLSADTLNYIIINSEKFKLFSVGITSDSLLDVYRQQISTSSISHVRQTILHHLLVHWQDMSKVELALKDTVHDPSDPHLVKLFQEFLIGGVYACAKGHIDEKVIALLTLSAAEPFHPQHETFLDGRIEMTITYTMLKDAVAVILSPNERHLSSRKTKDLWFMLWNHLQSHLPLNATPSPRFSSKAVRDRLLALGSPQVLKGIWPTPLDTLSSMSQDSANPVASFCSRFLEVAAEFRKAFVTSKKKINSTASRNNHFIDEIADDENDDRNDGYSQLEHIISLNLREVTVHLAKCLPGECAPNINNAVCNYVADRLHLSQVLCHLLFKLLEINPIVQGQDSHPSAFVHKLPRNTAKQLFMLLERYMVAAEEVVFPLPQGFEAFFSILAYKCLDIRTFLQYVDYGIVQLNSEVLHSVTTDVAAVARTIPCGMDEDNVMLEIIARLSRRKALDFIQHLHCSTTHLLQINHIVDRYLHHQASCNRYAENDNPVNDYGSDSMSASSTDNENLSEAYDALPPELTSVAAAMNSLLHHLQEGGARLKANSSTTLSSPSSPCWAAASCPSVRSSCLPTDLKRVKKTQLKNIARRETTSTAPFCMSVRPPISYWR